MALMQGHPFLIVTLGQCFSSLPFVNCTNLAFFIHYTNNSHQIGIWLLFTRANTQDEELFLRLLEIKK
jgi:hypothetical protein